MLLQLLGELVPAMGEEFRGQDNKCLHHLTGDRGIMDEDGYLWWTGRADDVPDVLGSEVVNACGYCY